MQSLRAIVFLAFATFASVLPAQEVAQNPVVTVDLERLVSETQIGQYLSFQMSEEAQRLQAEFDAIEAELSAEEADLIKKREILDLDEFRVLAKAFDEKAVRLRQEQQAKIQAITAESSRRRQDLLRSFVPVLSQVMRDRGATVLLDRRSVVLDTKFEFEMPLTCDVLLGDSLGEMHFYLALADQVGVGGGFAPQGSHNIIEPLSQCKPTIVGPNTWTIDFPAVEAIEAGVVRQVSPDELADALLDLSEYASADEFASVMGGSVEKTLDAVSDFMER